MKGDILYSSTAMQAKLVIKVLPQNDQTANLLPIMSLAQKPAQNIQLEKEFRSTPST